MRRKRLRKRPEVAGEKGVSGKEGSADGVFSLYGGDQHNAVEGGGQGVGARAVRY